MPSPQLHALLDSKLDTYERLEVVLALNAAGAPLTMTELAVQLQVGRDVLRRVAEDVAQCGMVEMLDGDLVRLTASGYEREILEAAEIYASDRGALIKALSRIAMERIRGMGARTFADAFRLRRKPGE